jgi:peptide subunit release factor 1 (eRF1)
VQEYAPHEEVVCGLTQVIEALNLFLVRRLIIGESLRPSGFFCRQHHFLSLGHGSCPFCSQPLLPVEDLVDEVVNIARVHGVNVTMVEFREDLLAAYQGIAAILYPHTASAVASD